MMKRNKVISVDEAVQVILDNDVIATGGLLVRVLLKRLRLHWSNAF